jgi:hypothetical protein
MVVEPIALLEQRPLRRLGVDLSELRQGGDRVRVDDRMI